MFVAFSFYKLFSPSKSPGRYEWRLDPPSGAPQTDPDPPKSDDPPETTEEAAEVIAAEEVTALSELPHGVDPLVGVVADVADEDVAVDPC